jgi:cytochrome c peroxidase
MKLTTTLLLGALSLSPLLSANEPIQPIKPAENINLALMELGKKLYFDPRLSKSGFISCNSCHNLSMGGTDNLPTSIGHKWNQGPINAPTVLNSSFNIAQFWDGRAKDLKEQAGGPIANPGEMASTHELATSVVKSIPGYVQEFALVFGKDKINADSMTSAIAEFEKTLVTPHSPFDKWLLGDKEAISAKELAGYELFKSSGCIGCHNGTAVGGSSYQKMGIIKKYQTANQAIGLAGVTKKDSDKFIFKVPTLRNIELTYPYFHDGATTSLSDAVNIMGEIQLGRKFSSDENDKIVAFLKTLTGDAPSFDLPQLPPSVAETPKPEPFK